MMIYYHNSSAFSLNWMHDFMDSDSEQQPFSPTVFLADLSPRHPSPHFSIEPINSNPHSCKLEQSLAEEGTLGSEKSAKKKLAGMKSREKKKKRLELLEESVRTLTTEIETCDCAISQCKDQLLEALQTAASTATEHSFTFAELERATRSGDGDLDRVNLLMDLIQNRIGANASQRQARLDYYFKQIINSLFPAMHRYLMHCALHERDLFGERQNDWTSTIYSEIQLTGEQVAGIAQRKCDLAGKHRQTVSLISKLKTVNGQLKNQEQIFERALTNIREDMSPVQSAQLILFGERNKLRKQFSLFCDQFAYQDSSKKIKIE